MLSVTVAPASAMVSQPPELPAAEVVLAAKKWYEEAIEIKGLPAKIHPKLERPSTALAFRQNEVTEHACRLTWKFQLYQVPTLQKPWLGMTVTDGHHRPNKVEIWDAKQVLVTCGCQDYYHDLSGVCLHTQAWKLFWREMVLWTAPHPRSEVGGTPFLVAPTPDEVKKWRLKVQVLLRKIPKNRTSWHVAAKVWDSSLEKCRVLGNAGVVAAAERDKSLYQDSESTKTARRLRVSVLDNSGSSETQVQVPDDPSSVLTGGIKLYDYQGSALRKMVAKKRLICSLAMGSGKTIMSIAAIGVLAQTRSRRVLVVCPKSLGRQWGQEFNRVLPQAQVVYAGETNREEWFSGSSAVEVVVTTYQYLQRNLEIFQEMTWDVVIADEVQFVKNGDSKTWKALKQVQAEFFWGLSGTVIENRLDDLASILEIVCPGAMGPPWKFLSDYQEVTEITRTKILFGGLKNLPKLHQKLEPWTFILPSSFAAGRLPPLTKTQVTVGMSAEQQEYHDLHYGEAKKLIAKSLKGPITHLERVMIQAHLLKARQACNTPELVTKNPPGVQPPKVREFLDLVQSCVDSESKLVVFSQWTEMLDILKREVNHRFPGIEYVTFDGSMSAKARVAALRKFQTDPGCLLFFASDAGGVGLDGLQQVCSSIVHVELPWNPAKLDQRDGRLHRIGQRSSVTSYTLVAQNTLESKMVELLASKREIREQALLMG